MCILERMVDEAELPLQIHAGMAGGAVILLEGDDYTGGCVNLASRLMDAAGPHEIFALPELAAHAPPGTPVEPVGMLTVAGLPPSGRGRAARVRTRARSRLPDAERSGAPLGVARRAERE